MTAKRTPPVAGLSATAGFTVTAIREREPQWYVVWYRNGRRAAAKFHGLPGDSRPYLPWTKEQARASQPVTVVRLTGAQKQLTLEELEAVYPGQTPTLPPPLQAPPVTKP